MTRALRRPVLVVAVVALVATAAAFTLGGGRADNAAAAVLPRCAHAQTPHARPAALRAFPLPAGTVLDSTTTKYGYTFISGFVPGAVNPVRDFLLAQVPTAGYRLGAGDSESNEAEAAFTGHGVRGKYKVRTLFGCPGAMTVEIAVRTLHA